MPTRHRENQEDFRENRQKSGRLFVQIRKKSGRFLK